MHEKVSVSVTPEEARELLVRRVERALLDSGITLTAAERDRLAAALPVRFEDGRDQPEVRPAPATVPPDTDLVSCIKARALKQSGNRARIYKPTGRAHPIEHPASHHDALIASIVRQGLCTADDLMRDTKLPRKAVYNGLWQLKREGLVDVIPVSKL